MITRHQMFEPLLEALPAFEPQWREFVAYWRGNPHNTGPHPDDLPNYLLLGDLATYLADQLLAGATDDVAAALAVCERWLLEGDHYVKEAATVGLIEDLQNRAQRLNIDEQRFIALLGPEGKFWWEKMNGFWNRKEPLVDERPMSPTEKARFLIDTTIGKIMWNESRKPRKP